MSETSNPRKEPEPIEKVWLSVSDYARLLRIEEAARRLRQWDIIAGPGTPEGEFTADAPYWRAELDRVLATEPSDA